MEQKDVMIKAIAQVAHETNRAYCTVTGDLSQPEWANAPDWQKESAINGVKFHLDNPAANPIDSHQNWLEEKRAAGWVWGPEKIAEDKVHPCMLEYHDLPIGQRIKDKLFIGVVRAMRKLV
jgi:hypothetical protein